MFSSLLEFSRLIINYMFPHLSRFSPTGALSLFFSSVVREQAGLEENTLRNYDPFHAEGESKSDSLRRGEWPPMISLHTFHFYTSFAFGTWGNLALALNALWKIRNMTFSLDNSQQGLSRLFLRLFFFFFHGLSASRYVCLGWPYAKLISRHG